jgi:hypothetical protein
MNAPLFTGSIDAWLALTDEISVWESARRNAWRFSSQVFIVQKPFAPDG